MGMGEMGRNIMANGEMPALTALLYTEPLVFPFEERKLGS
jgi:hypothetical protein